MDKLTQLFNMQLMLNDKIFSKKDIRNNDGNTLTMFTLIDEARRHSATLGPNSKVNEWLGKYLTALDAESQELRAWLLWKWWSKDYLDLQNLRVEIVDMLHFWISLAMTAGLDADMVFELYMKKNQVNLDRNEGEYSMATKTEEDNKTVVLDAPGNTPIARVPGMTAPPMKPQDFTPMETSTGTAFQAKLPNAKLTCDLCAYERITPLADASLQGLSGERSFVGIRKEDNNVISFVHPSDLRQGEACICEICQASIAARFTFQ